MKKRNFHLWFWAALLCGLSLSITSCKDDDDNGGQSDAQQEQQGREQQERDNDRFAILDQLANLSDAGDDFLAQKFEPTIGMPDGDDEGTRIVNTNTMQLAAQRFASLAEVSIDENTPSYTWTDEKLGTLTYTKVTDGSAWATVSVDIKQVPKLNKIIYREPSSQGDDNGAFQGSAYYRFGDVVSRTVTNKDGSTVTEYWICVRPAFGVEKKEDSHWVCLNTLPDKNIYTYHYKKEDKGIDKTWHVPYDLGKDEEHMQNLAEMLYAIIYPEKWQQNIINNPKIEMFHDFQTENVRFHNQNFWENVCKGWDKKGIWDKAFRASKEQIRQQIGDSNVGLNLLYKGYSWWSSVSWNCSFWQATYTNGTGTKANMHNKTLTTPGKSMENIKFDARKMGSNTENYIEFFGNDNKLRWPIRHAKGKELSSNGRYEVREPIPGVKEEYRYYQDIYPEKQLLEDPEVTAESSNAPAEGEAGTYMIGDVVEDEAGCRWFCINGSPYSATFSNATNRDAWFVSFEGIRENEKVASNIISESELPEVSFRFMEFIGTLINLNMDSYKYNPVNGTLGKIGEHIMNYAGVDLRKLTTRIDSTWTFRNFQTNQSYNSLSHSLAFNIAYNDGESTNRQPIARFIFDFTQAGIERTQAVAKSGKTYNSWRMLCYKNYETYDPGRITLTEDEQSLNMNKWQALWPVTNDKMTLQDVTDQTMINMHAKGDKWQKSPRTSAETSATIAEYCWSRDKKDFYSGKTSLFKEPVLFIRVMKVEDNGGQNPNLTSKDGKILKIVRMQYDQELYRHNVQNQYVGLYLVDFNNAFYLNNKHYRINPIPGFNGI